jgi:outer membrane biosynthesis protein TonB
MASANAPEISLRLEAGAYKRLTLALGISGVIHLVIFLLSLLVATGKLQWLAQVVPTWLKPEKILAENIKKQQQKPKPEQEIALVFVDVSPEQAVAEPPKKTQYYSDKSSRAANPEPAVDTEAPRIEGKQTDIVKTEDVPKNRTYLLVPTPPQTSKEDKPEEKAKPKYTPGDMVMAKPNPIPKETPGENEQDRPRTLKEARARQPNNRLVGEKMKQDGGVKRRNLASSLDVAGSEFGAYNAAIISAVQNRWYDLLDSRNYAGEQIGSVTVKFRLNADGSISEVAFVDTTVDLALGMLCQSAVKDPAPYAPWPSDMRRKIGDSSIEVTFKFFYR